MLKVTINDPSEKGFLAVGQNINQRVPEMFITIFFAFLNYISHIKVPIVLGCIMRAEFKLSSPTQSPCSYQHFDKLMSRNSVPLTKNQLFKRATKKLGSLSLNAWPWGRRGGVGERERRRENTIIVLDNNLSHGNSSLIAIQLLSAGNRHT